MPCIVVLSLINQAICFYPPKKCGGPPLQAYKAQHRAEQRDMQSIDGHIEKPLLLSSATIAKGSSLKYAWNEVMATEGSFRKEKKEVSARCHMRWTNLIRYQNVNKGKHDQVQSWINSIR